mmetsp:Transcript_45240/g.101565  ORF Transcript_45240/g.101565 Transcript_45240/m.101565 type:complete len:89 (-) Transcript_45240:23-289(-)
MRLACGISSGGEALLLVLRWQNSGYMRDASGSVDSVQAVEVVEVECSMEASNLRTPPTRLRGHRQQARAGFVEGGGVGVATSIPIGKA